MNQQEFNKQEIFDNLIKTALEKKLGYQFILQEFKRNKWNLNTNQAEKIGLALNFNPVLVLLGADDLNILNVDSKTKKAIQKQRKNKDLYE